MSQLLIVNYHRVDSPHKDARYRSMFITPELLRFHIRFLKRCGYRFSTVTDALKRPGEDIACLTFDDGYLDNFRKGFPVLRTMNVPATVYVVTGAIGGHKIVWRESGDKLPSDILSWDQLKRLRDEGWEIGGHTHDHVHLDRYPKEIQKNTIVTSKQTLEKELGVKIESFAYPYGHYNHDTLAVVRAAGFTNAVTTKAGINGNSRSTFELQRISMGGYAGRHYLQSIGRFCYHLVRSS